MGVELVPVTVTDATVQLKRLYDAGARVIQIDHMVNGSKVVLEDAERLGIKDDIIFIHWYLNFRDTIPLSNLFDGTYNSFTQPTYYTDNRLPAIDRVGKFYLENGGEAFQYSIDWNIHVHHNLTLAIQAIKNALEQYGYEGFTRERLRNAMFGLKRTTSGFLPKFDINPRFPLTLPYALLFRIDGKNKRLHQEGPIVAPGPGLYQQDWNPSDDPKQVLTNYYKWP